MNDIYSSIGVVFLVSVLLFWVISFFFCAIVSMSVAKSKGRSGPGWFFLGLLLGPLALAVALLPSYFLVQCPECAEYVKAEARKCRYCGELFAVEEG